MGTLYSDEYTENEPPKNFDHIPNHQYEPNEFHLLNDQLKKMEEAKKNNIIIDEDSKTDKNIKDHFSKKYEQYIDIKRFSIPIIGSINSGKSTFMNRFLNLNDILQVDSQVTTRFIAIIRHDKNAEIPEVYRVKIERRNQGNCFNFIETGENLLEQNGLTDIKKIIKDLNEDIYKNNSQNSEKYKYDVDKYFLIVKTKIPLFEGDYEEYGNLIDFLDIPGLDEAKDTPYSTGSIFNDFIGVIFFNIIFPLFIFEVKNFANDNADKVFENFFNLYAEKKFMENSKESEILYEKGIFLMNKTESLDDNTKKQIFESFKEKFNERTLSNGTLVRIPLEENENYFAISAQQLFLAKKGSFIEDELPHLKSESTKTTKNSFRLFLKEYLFEKYKINLNEAKEEKEDFSLKENLNAFNKLLEKNFRSLNNPKLDLKEYTYLSKINPKNESDNNNKIMLTKIQQKIKSELDYFLNFEFEGIMKKRDLKNSKEKIKFDEKKNFDNNFLLNFNKKVLSLFPPDVVGKYENIKTIVQKVEDFSVYYNNNNVRIVFLGIISSGKTSLLNSIIGNHLNILQSGLDECTKCIYRIKYSEKISFCESEIKSVNKDKNKDVDYGDYFVDKEETRIYDITEIKNKIKSLNRQGSFNIYTYYVPIEGLESIKNKENIELIDLPGLKEEIIGKINLKQIFNMCDGFIFIFNSLSIADENSQYIFKTIIKYIKERNDGFNFKNCLFHLNYIDEIEEDLIEKKVGEFKSVIMKTINQEIYKGSFVEKLALKENILASNDISVSYISNTFYEQYQDYADNILSLKFIENEKLENAYDNYILEEFDENQIQKLIVKNRIERNYKKELEEKIKCVKQKSQDKNDDYILKIAKFLIIFEKHKKELIKKYKSSKADFFFIQFHNQINIAQKNNLLNLHKKICFHLLNVCFNLLYFDELCSQEGKIEYYKKKIELKKQTIENEYKRIENVIKKKFDIKIKEIETDYKEVLLTKIKDERKLSVEEVKEKIKDLNIDEKLDNLINSLYKDLTKINLNFIYFCINEITSLLNSKDFNNIVTGISKSFIGVDDSGLKKVFIISGGIALASSFATSISTTTLGLTLGVMGTVYAGIIFVPLLGVFIYTMLKDNNTEKVNAYFNIIIKELNKNKESFLKSIKEKKDDFINQLVKKESISSKEINLLKELNFPQNLTELIKLFQ